MLFVTSMVLYNLKAFYLRSINSLRESKQIFEIKALAVVHTSSPSIRVAETVGLQVQGHLILLRETLPQQLKSTTHKLKIVYEGLLCLLLFHQDQ